MMIDLQDIISFLRLLPSIVMWIFAIIGIIMTIIGVLPVIYRLGRGLSKRKIAVFALHDEFINLKTMLVESKIFKEKNIIQIHPQHLKNAQRYNIFLVHWKDYKNLIDEILSIKESSTALIVYAPQDAGKIESETFNKISSQPNSTLVNLRGRLLNDIFVSLMTTGYKRKNNT